MTGLEELTRIIQNSKIIPKEKKILEKPKEKTDKIENPFDEFIRGFKK